ncbi:hypothetical protein XELAEV_18024801mg [Xenopus laevis]|uniref:Neurotransmitter-gated ion-channel transmembrane domain-containing protein n=1 Tax=Xenopus laevis TaxID=8355 RepID=A0A974D0Q8_XENLA|nr:hypothetical protein XELAEV_18024801mg [Xenopus laevis]
MLSVRNAQNQKVFHFMTFSRMVYNITIKWASVVYVINIIIPACSMVLLDIASMFIQLGSGERLGFKITVVLGFSVLLLILNDMVPSSDSPPVLGIFCAVCLILMVTSIIGSVITNYMMMILSDMQPNVPNWITWSLERKRLRQRSEVPLELNLLKRLLVAVLRIHQELNMCSNKQDAKSEWYVAALVVDRLILFLYIIIIIIISSILIIVWAK